MVEFWLDESMEDRQFDSKCWDLWERIAPAYRQLHAFIRAKLREKYPGEITEDEPIPVHLKSKLINALSPERTCRAKARFLTEIYLKRQALN
jgi:hypothetical protein